MQELEAGVENFQYIDNKQKRLENLLARRQETDDGQEKQILD